MAFFYMYFHTYMTQHSVLKIEKQTLKLETEIQYKRDLELWIEFMCR